MASPSHRRLGAAAPRSTRTPAAFAWYSSDQDEFAHLVTGGRLYSGQVDACLDVLTVPGDEVPGRFAISGRPIVIDYLYQVAGKRVDPDRAACAWQAEEVDVTREHIAWNGGALPGR